MDHSEHDNRHLVYWFALYGILMAVKAGKESHMTLTCNY